MTWRGWSIAYWTSQPAAGWPFLVRRELQSALPGASVEVLSDPEVDLLSVNPPEGIDADVARIAVELAARAVERVALKILKRLKR